MRATAATAATAVMSPPILKRGDPSRRRDNDYDVLEDGKVVGRIFHLEAAAPEGRPWMWASGHSAATIKRAAHGYEATREAAMAAFAKVGGERVGGRRASAFTDSGNRYQGREEGAGPYLCRTYCVALSEI